MPDIIPLDQIDDQWIDQLLDRAFGTDRHKRTAYRVREGMDYLPALSFGAVEDERIVGSIQCWPVRLTQANGRKHPMIMVGPVAVIPDRQQSGIGKALMLATLGALNPEANLPQVMIGDPEYYDRFFGFSNAHTAGWTLPGPYEQHRLLARYIGEKPLPEDGMLGPWD